MRSRTGERQLLRAANRFIGGIAEVVRLQESSEFGEILGRCELRPQGVDLLRLCLDVDLLESCTAGVD
jgi:hypothetical protein